MFGSLNFFVLFACCVGLSAAGTVTAGDHENVFNYEENKKTDCGLNEVLKQCVGCPPEDSCYDRDQYICPALSSPCSAECVCKEGFIRKTQDSECIPKEECGAICETFEEYTDCKQCTNETCSSIQSPVKCDSKVSCTPGCTCLDGYYREDENSTCLPRCSCPEMEDSPDYELFSWRYPKYEIVLG